MSRGAASHQKMAARFTRYCQLRDDGATVQVAITAVGLSYSPAGEGTSARYERAYRRVRGITRTRSAPDFWVRR